MRQYIKEDQCELKYNNRFGELVLELIGKTRPVNGLLLKDFPQDCLVYDDFITTAEKIALISDNRWLQIVFSHPKFTHFGIVAHINESSVKIARVIKLDFHSRFNQTKEIQLAMVRCV